LERFVVEAFGFVPVQVQTAPDHPIIILFHLECGVAVRGVWLVIIGHMGFEFVSDADAFAGIEMGLVEVAMLESLIIMDKTYSPSCMYHAFTIGLIVCGSGFSLRIIGKPIS
jgi:hypothetical protein